MDLTKEQQEEEWIRCKFNPYHFLKEYVKVEEPGVGPAPFLLLPHVIQLVHRMLNEQWLAVLKARQTYVTHTAAGLTLHGALFVPSHRTLYTSKGEDEGKDFIKILKFMREHLPDFLNQSTGSYGAEEISFPKNGGSIRALPSTKVAGIGKHVSRHIGDEEDFHEYASENFGMIKPTVDKGGQMLLISTINPESQTTFFKTVYRKAMKGEGQFKRYFIPWNVLPERDTKWLDRVCDNDYTESGMSKELYKSTQYPSNELEALSPPSAIAAFDHKVLSAMRDDLDNEKPWKTDGPIKYWRGFTVGHTYTAFTDTADGTGQDYSVTVVLDIHVGLIVADIVSNVMGPEEMAFQANKMLAEYKFPLWGIENCNRGVNCVNAAIALNYPDLFYQDWQKEYKRTPEKKTAGWNTGPSEGMTKHRIILWGEGVSAVDRGDIRILNKEGLGQFFSVIKNPKNKGRTEGQKGTHDDYPFAVCGAWQMTKFITQKENFCTGESFAKYH